MPKCSLTHQKAEQRDFRHAVLSKPYKPVLCAATLVACLLCAVPFLIIGIFEKNSKEPITFWSGDKTLKSKVKDVTAYNLEMGVLYQKCAFAFMLSGICCLISLGFGIVMLVLDCTAGVYLMYRSYKRILERNS